MLIEIELEKLRDEIYDLKKCQVDFIRLSLIIFGAIATIIGALLPYLKIFENNIFNPWILLIYILIISIIPITFPYILWIIIHKSRSIFRIVAYIRAVEHKLSSSNNYINEHVGYETLHRKLREFPWLSVRITSFSNIFKRIIMNFSGYRKSTEKANKEYNKIFKNANQNLISVDGLEKGKSGPYIGDYYGRIIFFIKILTSLGYLALIPFIFIGIKNSPNEYYQLLFIFIGVLIIVWAIYQYRLSRRYLMEIRFRPFSMDAYFDMWIWAINDL